MACAKWLVQSARPLTFSERDKPFLDFIEVLCRGAWSPLSFRNIHEKMARQNLGRPASSAGVKRMFSKAGRLHDDLKASQSDDTLEHALLAAANLE